MPGTGTAGSRATRTPRPPSSTYVRLYKQQWDELTESDGEAHGTLLLDYRQRSIVTTWTMSLKAIQVQSQPGSHLLLVVDDDTLRRRV